MVAHLGSPSVEQGILQSAASRLPPSTILPQSYRDFDPEAHPELKKLPDPSEIRVILRNLALRSGQKIDPESPTLDTELYLIDARKKVGLPND